MYNLRYHVASLVAVFLFLSVGLLLGTIVAERGVLDTQRDTLISSLRNQYEEMSAENDELAAIGDERREFIEDTLPLLLDGQLEGRTVVVLSSAERADGLAAVTDLVTRAGGSAISVPVLIPGLGLDDEIVSQEASAALALVEGQSATLEQGEGTDEETDEVERVLAALAEEWSVPGVVRPITEALGTAGAIDVADYPTGVAADAIVVLASWDDVPDATVVDLARKLYDLGVPVAAIEVSTQPTGLASTAVERGLSAVEEIGTPESDFALVMVLSGRATGYYGPGEGTEARYPVLTMEE